jgi:hypothetical protein
MRNFMLSDERIAKFQALYKKHFNEDLSKEEAYDLGAKLLRMVQLVYKPITEKEYQEWQNRLKDRQNKISNSGYDTNTLSYQQGNDN